MIISCGLQKKRVNSFHNIHHLGNKILRIPAKNNSNLYNTEYQLAIMGSHYKKKKRTKG